MRNASSWGAWGGKEEGAILETFGAELVDKESWERRADDMKRAGEFKEITGGGTGCASLERRCREEQAECQCRCRNGYICGCGSGREYEYAEGGNRSPFGSRSWVHGRCHDGDGLRSAWIQGQEN